MVTRLRDVSRIEAEGIEVAAGAVVAEEEDEMEKRTVRQQMFHF